MAKLPELLLLIKIAGLWRGSERRAERDAMSFAARAPSRGSLGSLFVTLISKRGGRSEGRVLPIAGAVRLCCVPGCPALDPERADARLALGALRLLDQGTATPESSSTKNLTTANELPSFFKVPSSRF